MNEAAAAADVAVLVAGAGSGHGNSRDEQQWLLQQQVWQCFRQQS